MPTISSNKGQARYNLDHDVLDYLNATCTERGKGAFVSMAVRHYVNFNQTGKEILEELKRIGFHLGLREHPPLALKPKQKP